MEDLVTVFTPTYNRASTLTRLYMSLCEQTCKIFQWLIVDDGSIDGTERLVREWLRDSRIKIRYYKQANKGKSMAHNRGVELTNTELFVCVDSDDYLTIDAIEKVSRCWKTVKNKNSGCIGILAFRMSTDAKPITQIEHKIEYSTLMNAYRYCGLSGDTMLVYRTNVISKYRFPEFENEKFVPESYLYDLLDREGELYIFREKLYYSEYLDDGYTKNIRKTICKNPNGYLAYINQRIKLESDLKYLITDMIRYVSVKLCLNIKISAVVKEAVYPSLAVVCLLPGVIFYNKYYRNVLR